MLLRHNFLSIKVQKKHSLELPSAFIICVILVKYEANFLEFKLSGSAMEIHTKTRKNKLSKLKIINLPYRTLKCHPLSSHFTFK